MLHPIGLCAWMDLEHHRNEWQWALSQTGEPYVENCALVSIAAFGTHLKLLLQLLMGLCAVCLTRPRQARLLSTVGSREPSSLLFSARAAYPWFLWFSGSMADWWDSLKPRILGERFVPGVSVDHSFAGNEAWLSAEWMFEMLTAESWRSWCIPVECGDLAW